MKWYKTSEKLPKMITKFSESDYILCLEPDSTTPFVGWYNHKMDQWYVAHHSALGGYNIRVKYWGKLPKGPSG